MPSLQINLTLRFFTFFGRQQPTPQIPSHRAILIGFRERQPCSEKYSFANSFLHVVAVKKTEEI